MYFIILIRFLQIEKFTAVNIHEMRCKAKMTLFSSKFAASLNFAQALLGLIAIPDNIDWVFFFLFSFLWIPFRSWFAFCMTAVTPTFFNRDIRVAHLYLLLECHRDPMHNGVKLFLKSQLPYFLRNYSFLKVENVEIFI